MHIISGRLKGRKICRPKGIRPTQDKVRKALFDILSEVEGLSFLELFAGSGAVGLEAASQGAERVVFVEKDPSCVAILKDNLALLPGQGHCLLSLDVFKAVGRLAQEHTAFDIIFLDPPYYKDREPRHRKDKAVRVKPGTIPDQEGSLAKKTLKMLSSCDILTPNGFVVIQHFVKDVLPDSEGGLIVFKQSRYADTQLSFYKKGSPSAGH